MPLDDTTRTQDSIAKRHRVSSSSLLRNLIIDDNIHSPFVNINEQLASSANANGTDPLHSRRRNTNRKVNYVFKSRRPTAVRNSRENIDSSPRLLLPDSIDEANQLNPYIKFSNGLDDTTPITPYGKLTIKYNPLKLYNFKKILHNSSSDESRLHHDNDTSFPVNPQKDRNSNDHLADSILPYNGAIPKQKDFSTLNTTPTTIDRQFFHDLLIQSSNASHFNANVTLSSYNQNLIKGTKKRLTQPPHGSSSIEYIFINNHEIKTWYNSPFPSPINKNKILHICDRCLKYYNSRYQYHRHDLKCPIYLPPPGNEIYRDGAISFWEIDGRENVTYCQNLCLLSKLFLNSKTLYYDVDPFIFYVLTERGKDNKYHLIGYFSKEKLNSLNYNLSCILTLPIYQRRGFGHLLMEFSYLLSMREFKSGTPEKPLSDLGLLAYRNFWKIKMATTLVSFKDNLQGKTLKLSLNDLSNLTGMITTDVVFGLEQLQVLYKSTTTSSYIIKIDSWSRIEEIVTNWSNKNYQTLNPSKLIWKPMIFGPSFGVNTISIDPISSTTSTNMITKSGTDFFNKHIDTLTNFMTDDILDPTDLEIVTREAILQNLKNSDDVDTENINADDYEICFVEPTLNEKSSSGSSKRPTTTNSTNKVTETQRTTAEEQEEEEEEVNDDLDLLEPIEEPDPEDDEEYSEEGEDSTNAIDESSDDDIDNEDLLNSKLELEDDDD
ncbi:hypothetical protein NCAS_0E02750 [Naumovozyma castellii]|uniref:Histone acetyltransferase n=1 Tax=Naumovozyma castellii TaxID=27288 RepID=G0VFS8_NAUCA|nr:hypothetical protein NCAS_0E02750 [Naumovozyma castellii CBS 4309]CCC70345.1 hypothetical protein NCAS_0E02750 [Naumovozyma castellii CBS 4309]